MNRAIDTGEMTISGESHWFRETQKDVQHGFLMYLLYGRGGRRTTVQRIDRPTVLGLCTVRLHEGFDARDTGAARLDC